MKKVLALAFCVSLALASSQARAQGYWKFDEGAFQPLCPGNPLYDATGHAVDWSGTGNHACIENPQRNAKYTSDAYAGPFAMFFNDPADVATKIYPGFLFVPHSTTLELPTGMIEAAVKVPAFPTARASLFNKSTFWFVRTEPVLPVFNCSGTPCLIGRTVYQLEIGTDGRVLGIIGNDDPATPGAPWTELHSTAPLTIGAWNQLAMKWDGCQLTVTLNGSSASVPYNPVPVLGLSYQGTGNDPTLGPLTLPAGIGSDPLVGQVDEVRLSPVTWCNGLAAASTTQLITNVRSLNLRTGLANGLVAILDQVVAKLGPDPTPIGPDPTPFGPDPTPIHLLRTFVTVVNAQSGRLIAPPDAGALTGTANKIIVGLTTN